MKTTLGTILIALGLIGLAWVGGLPQVSLSFIPLPARRLYSARKKATISIFSCAVDSASEIKLKNSTVSSSVSKRPSCM